MLFPFGVNRYPWTNFHALNLDWLISAMKKCEKAVEDSTAKIDGAIATANDAKTTADAAKQTADNAVDTANSANSTAASAAGTAASALQTANTANSAATAAAGSATNAIQTANAAEDTANDALTAANAAKEKIDNYKVPLATNSAVGGIYADNAESGDTQPVRIRDGRLYTAPGGGSGGGYTLPTASADVLGGVKADSKTAADTQPVKIGADGKLYTKPAEEYSLPTAAAAVLGGVMADAKTTKDTQPVKIGTDNKLYTKPIKFSPFQTTFDRSFSRSGTKFKAGLFTGITAISGDYILISIADIAIPDAGNYSPKFTVLLGATTDTIHGSVVLLSDTKTIYLLTYEVSITNIAISCVKIVAGSVTVLDNIGSPKVSAKYYRLS